MTDYHSKPLLGVRVEADLQGWGRDEAKRRSQSFGDFVAGLFAAERDRMDNHVVNPAPAVFVAAEDEQPRQAVKNCRHPNFRGVKGVCPDCYQPVGYK